MANSLPIGYTYKDHKYRLYPTIDQRNFFDACIIANDWFYNWALDLEIRQKQLYDQKLTDKSFLSQYDLYNLSIEYIHNNQVINLGYNIPISVYRGAIDNLIKAFDNYMNKSLPNNYPIHKSENNSNNSFHLRPDRFFVDHDKVKISGLKRYEMVDLKFDTGLDESNTYYLPSVVKDNLGNYYVCFRTLMKQYDILNAIPISQPIGIDINARKDSRIVLSNGYRFHEPIELQRAIIKVKNLQKELSYYKGKVDSNNKIKLLNSFHKAYLKVSNITNTFYHTAIKQILFTNPAGIVIEDINVTELKRNHYIADDIHHACFDQFRQMMQYECNLYGYDRLIVAPHEFKSSKICCNCGYINEDLRTDALIYKCPNCGYFIDRDLNAAINLEQLYFGKRVLLLISL